MRQLLCTLLSLCFAFALQAQVTIAEQDFNSLSSAGTFNTDMVTSGMMLSNSGAMNMGSGLDMFITTWIDTRGETTGPVTATGDSNDFIGVNSFSGTDSPDVAADGTPVSAGTEHNFEFNDGDGELRLTFGAVDVSGYTNRTLSLNYWINATGFESDDRFRVIVMDNASMATVLDLGEVGLEMSGSADDGTANWQTLTVDLDATITANGLNESAITLQIFVDNNSGNENIFIDNIEFSGELPVSGCDDLFFSEYIEGSSNNKCIEIYNPTDAAIDLAAGDYEISISFNGGSSTSTIDLTGTVASGDVYVVCDDGSAPDFLAQADQTPTSGFWNGDDAISLIKNGTTLDIFGSIGTDPGSQWGTTATNETQNQTLRRNSNITGGITMNPAPDFPSLQTEWTEFANNDVSGLGSHTSDCITAPTCSITNVVATTPECGTPPNENDSFFDISFDVVAGSGDYLVLNPANSVSYTSISSAATDGFVMSAAAATPAGTPGMTETVRVSDSNNPSCFAEITIDVPVCPVMDCPNEAFISEFHYDNAGTDVEEFVEVAVSNDFNGDLANLEVFLYNGSNGTIYGTHDLSTFTEGMDDGTYKYYYKYISGIQNGAPDGLALACDGMPLEFLSYEGTFDANIGPFVEQTSTDVGVQESSSTPDGSSIQLIDGVWTLSCTSTEGTPNVATPYSMCCDFGDVQINEIHYDNSGTDVNEFVEIAVDDSYTGNLSDVTLTLYNGSTGASYNTLTLDNATSGSTVGGTTYYYFDFPSNGIQNGAPDGLAVSCLNGVQEFLSYEGEFMASNGPANGQMSEDLEAAETGGQVASGSLQRIEDEVDFWAVTCQNTKGDENENITECCDLEITGVSATDENCAGSADGTITITATCSTCAGIEYSVDNGMNWQPSNMFTGLAAGTYFPLARDTDDENCLDEGASQTVGTAADTEAPVANCPSPAAGMNILNNPSFENGAAHNTPFGTDYGTFGAVFALEGALTAPVSASEGDYYLKIFGGASGVTQSHPMNPGETVTATVDVLNASFDPMLPGCFGLVKVEFYNSSGGKISEVEGNKIFHTDPQNQWLLSSVTAVAPPGTVSVLYVAVMVCPAGGAVMFDNATMSIDDGSGPSSDFVLNNNPGLCGAIFNYTIPDPTDNCSATSVADIPSGSLFDVGTNVVTVTATDAAGNSSACTFNVIVNDVEAPVANCPTPPDGSNLLVNPSFEDNNGHDTPFSTDYGTFGAVFVLQDNFTAPVSASDGNSYLKIFGAVSGITQSYPIAPGQVVDASVDILSASFDPMLPGCFGLVKVEFFDANGIEISETEGNIVLHTIPQNVWTPSTVTATAPAGAVSVQYVAVMLCPAGGAVMFDNASLSINGNNPGDFTIMSDPALCGATVSFTLPASTDNCPGVTTSTSFASGSFLPVGTSSLVVTATDASGNSSNCTVNIDIEDTVPPSLVCLDATVDFNGEDMITVSIDDLFDADASFDNCGTINLITIDQMVTCDQLGDVIPVTVTGADASGNQGTCSATITVDGLPCGYMSQDIGCNGDNEYDYDVASDEFSITSDGCTPSFPYVGDSQAFIKTELCGDGYIKAFVEDVNGDGFAGIQMRNGLDPGAKKVEIGTNKVNRLLRAYRVIDNYPSFPQEVYSLDKFWLKIERNGDIFRAYASIDDIVYVPYLYQSIIMDDCLDVGMFVYSKNGQVVSADFSNVEVVEYTSGLSAEERTTLQGDNALNIGDVADFVPSNTNTATLDISLTPNPARDLVTLNLDQVIGEAAFISIFNINGQLMNQIQLDSVEDATEEIDIHALPAGTYYVNVKTTSTQRTLKLIKQ